MLKSLQIFNFALIEHMTIDFDSGLTVLTGETGSGKSILIDAISVAVGGRASNGMIRTGCDFFRIEAVFDVSGNGDISALQDEHDIIREDDMLIITRRMSQNGKNTVTINGCQTTLAVLKKIGEVLLDMHGQHENQALLRPNSHLTLLDSSNAQITEILQRYKQKNTQWNKVLKKLNELKQTTREKEQRIDMLKWQASEIEAAKLKPGEEEELEAEVGVLANFEKIAGATAKISGMLTHNTKYGVGVLDMVNEVRRELDTVMRYDTRMKETLQSVQDAWYLLDDAANTIADYNSEIEYNPQRMAMLQDRLDTIHKLKKKYGIDINEILAHYDAVKEELAILDDSGDNIAELEGQAQELERELSRDSDALDKLRRKAALKLSKEIGAELADLAMPHATLEFDISTTDEYGTNGRNKVVLVFSANKGEELKPLHKIASGGELSRLALAIKTVVAFKDDAATMVFDEIDTGIGGKTAQRVAEKVAFIAERRQVLAISHLPTMACMADRHLLLTKTMTNSRTYTTLSALSEEERIQEITRMVSGDINPLALQNTVQLLKNAAETKEKWRKEKIQQ